MRRVPIRAAAVVLGLAVSAAPSAQGPAPDVDVVRIGTGLGYDGSNVNSVSFRTDPLATHGHEQFAAFYDDNERLIVAKRTLGSTVWQVSDTGHTAAISDAHRTISIAVDGDGVLHVSWGHHGGPFNYIRGVTPGSLTMTGRLTMPGIDFDDSTLTYPEFFYLPDGNLLFTYRLGGSGNGDTYIQRYERATQTWTRLHDPTILGRTGDTVNAYPNGMVLDSLQRFHWTWCWRDSPNGPDENHDQLYARSPDFGTTWTRIDGTPYLLPITEATAEVARAVPKNSYMGNHSHMAVGGDDRPMIAQYYDPGGGRRIMLTWYDGAVWQSSEVTGVIGWTRPLILVDGWERVHVFYVQGGTLRLAYTGDPLRASWTHVDVVPSFKGNDPVFDRKRFEAGDEQVDIFYQHRVDLSVNVLEFRPATFDPPAPPLPPTALHALGGDGEVRLTWDAPYGAAGYEIRRSATSGGPYTTIGSASGPSFVDTGVANDTPYHYVVRAFNDAGASTETAQVRAVPRATTSRAPLADAYVRAGIHADDSHGAEDVLLAKTASPDFTRESFLRFDVRGLEHADRAVLRLVPTATGAEGDATIVDFERIDDDRWDESTVTWNTRPATGGSLVARRTGFTTGVPVEIDVTRVAREEAARDGLLSLRVSSAQWGDPKIVHFAAREHAVPGNRPSLVYSVAAGPRASLADTYARGGVHAETAHGTADRILAKLDGADTTREAFLRFDVTGLANATQATLTLMPIATGADGATTTLSFERIADDAWVETDLTWNTRPTVAGDPLAGVTGFTTGVPVALDVTAAVREEAAGDGWLSMRVVSTVPGGGRIVHFGSRERGSAIDQPALDATTAPPAPGSVGAALRLALEPDGATLRLTWGPSCSEDGSDYGIYEGLLGDFASHTSIDCSDDGNDRTETVAPGAGDRYYLVVPHDLGAEGSYGAASDGAPRTRGGTVCRADQIVASCP